MYIHQIEARDLPDLWFLAVHDILDNGRRFVIDRGSYAGQTRLEYDYFMGHVKHPGTQPLIPDIPPACGIPNPVEHDYIYGGSGYDRAYIEYLMSARKEPGESYTYGERLTKVPLTGDKLAWWEAGNTEIVDKREVDGGAVFEENGHLYLNQIEWVIKTYKDFGERNNQLVLQIAHPSDLHRI
jgi:thymidylate synthase